MRYRLGLERGTGYISHAHGCRNVAFMGNFCCRWTRLGSVLGSLRQLRALPLPSYLGRWSSGGG